MIDFDKLDRTIHETGRLAIMTLLVTRPEWSFPDLKQELGMSDGNLITHLRKLESAGYLIMRKEAQMTGRAVTMCALSEAGREAFDAYLKVLGQIVEANRDGK